MYVPVPTGISTTAMFQFRTDGQTIHINVYFTVKADNIQPLVLFGTDKQITHSNV